MSAINEKVFVDINSSKQGMFIRGEDATSPVLLFLHGGPGSPEHGMTMAIEDADNRLENCFVVCYWDQRGAGMSFHSSINPETMTLHQMIEDTAAVTRYLLSRFGQEKIYLFGHSWGSYLGIKTIERYPQLYHALINVGQVCDQTQSERLAYTYMLAHARKIGDKRAEKQLLRFDISANSFPDTKYVQGVRSSLMNKYGIGIIHDKNIATMKGLIRNLFLFKGYTLREKINYLRGLTFSQKLLFPGVLADSLPKSSTSFEIPVYILQGAHDYQVSYSLAKEYCAAIHAPDKQFYSFSNRSCLCR